MADSEAVSVLTTPPVRVSYPQVFVPRAIQEGAEPKYGIVLMFDKTNSEHNKFLNMLHAKAQKAMKEKWPDPTKRPRIPIVGHDMSCIKDGDTACNKQGVPLIEKNPEYAGHFIVRAGSKRKPGIVDKGRAEIMDKEAIYGGCSCKINLNPYAYDTKGNKGVTFGLNGVQFWGDGEAFGGGRPSTEDMFQAETGQNDPSSYEPKDDSVENPFV